MDGINGGAATVWLVNKTATRLPEATFLAFNPDEGDLRWEISKLGRWERPAPGWVVAGGSKHLHATSPTGGGARFSSAARGATVTIETVDTAVLNLGAPNAFPVPTDRMDEPWDAEPDLGRHGVSSVIHSNVWGTNYVMWYPFRREGRDVDRTIVARFGVRF